MYRGYFIKVILFFYYFHVCLSVQPVTDTEINLPELKEQNVSVHNINGLITGSLFGTVKKYFCKVNMDEESDFLLYGTKSWTFPAQDVSLTLAYPSKNFKNNNIYRVDHILTEFKVVFFLDGNYSRGFISEGGMLQNNIKLTFVFRNITSLSYQFYLYGIPTNSTTILHKEPNNFYWC